MRRISPQELIVTPFSIFDRQWALLVAGSAFLSGLFPNFTGYTI